MVSCIRVDAECWTTLILTTWWPITKGMARNTEERLYWMVFRQDDAKPHRLTVDVASEEMEDGGVAHRDETNPGW
jgi:hypothetical protein